MNLSYTGGLQRFCKKGKQLWIKILKAYNFLFWSWSLKRGLITKIQSFSEDRRDKKFYTSPQIPSIFQTITNLMKTFEMKGTDQRVSHIRSVLSAVWAQLSNSNPSSAQRFHESFFYLWSLWWYMEFIQVLIKVNNYLIFFQQTLPFNFNPVLHE